MIRAISAHVWLLLTLRHPMTGLPRQFGHWCAIVLTATAVAWLRWGTPAAAAQMLILCGIVGHHSPRAAAAYALLSIGIDITAIPVELIHGGRIPYFFSVWEGVGAGAIALRCWRA